MTIREKFDIPGVPPGWWKDDDPTRSRAGRAIQKDTVARKSYNKLVASGIHEPELLEFLVARTVWSFYLRPLKHWYSTLGKTAKALKDFCKRLRSIANEVEKTTERLRWTGLLFEPIGIPIRSFNGIPELLGRYAAFICVAARKKRTQKRELVSAAKDELIQFVREETGRPQYEELSNLLIAVAHDAGLEPDIVDHNLSLTALKQRTYRRNRISSSPKAKAMPGRKK